MGHAPLDQSTFYQCEVKDAEQCSLIVDAAPGTKYEASVFYLNDNGEVIINQLKLLTWPEDGETGLNVSLKPLEQEDHVFIQVVSDPSGNGSYPAVLGVKGCGE